MMIKKPFTILPLALALLGPISSSPGLAAPTPAAVPDTVAGATSYRIEVVAGRYVVAGQALDDPGMKFAHAERIRCIRAPCPPDTAIIVDVGAGAATNGIDLSLGEALPPG